MYSRNQRIFHLRICSDFLRQAPIRRQWKCKNLLPTAPALKCVTNPLVHLHLQWSRICSIPWHLRYVRRRNVDEMLVFEGDIQTRKVVAKTHASGTAALLVDCVQQYFSNQ